MSVLSADMAYEIGDLVYLRTARHDDTHTPARYMVLGRIVQECHGGVQRQYELSGLNGWVPEILITREPPPDQRSRYPWMPSYMESLQAPRTPEGSR